MLSDRSVQARDRHRGEERRHRRAAEAALPGPRGLLYGLLLVRRPQRAEAHTLHRELRFLFQDPRAERAHSHQPARHDHHLLPRRRSLQVSPSPHKHFWRFASWLRTLFCFRSPCCLLSPLPHGRIEVLGTVPGVPFPRVRLGARHFLRRLVSELLRGRFRAHPQILPQRHGPQALAHRQAVPHPPRRPARRTRRRREKLKCPATTHSIPRSYESQARPAKDAASGSPKTTHRAPDAAGRVLERKPTRATAHRANTAGGPTLGRSTRAASAPLICASPRFTHLPKSASSAPFEPKTSLNFVTPATRMRPNATSET